MKRSIGAFRILAVAFVVAVPAGRALSAVFTNSTPITMPGPGSSAGSAILVSGLGTSISIVPGMSVTVMGFSDTHPSDVGLVLVGPTGAALVLMGDCAGSTSIPPITVNFSDGAASLMPQSSLNSSGSFQPAQYASIGSFPSPGPGLAYKSPAIFGTSTFGSTFGSTNPNGEWSLFAMDPDSGDSGQISGGWSLQITAVPEPASLPLVVIGGVSVARRRRR